MHPVLVFIDNQISACLVKAMPGMAAKACLVKATPGMAAKA
jgi:hypothetical protein